MLELNSEEWKKLDGGYRQPYDASVILRKLSNSAESTKEFWDEVWNNLYHQNDVGTATYAVIPWVLRLYRENNWIDWQLPSFAFAVEQARLMGHNPQMPLAWQDEYFRSIEEIAEYCLKKRSDYVQPQFRKSVVMLVAIMMGATDIAELVDFIEIGDEQRALELYANN